MKKILKHPLLILGIGFILIAGSSIGATRAAITYQNAAQQVDFSTSTLSVDLQEERGDEGYVSVLEDGALEFTSYTDEENGGHIGQEYAENVRVVNTSEGGYDEYVRIYVRKSWVQDGVKSTYLDPELIELGINTDVWKVDTTDHTTEGDVYYYTKPLAKDEKVQFISTLTINDKILTYVKTVPAYDEDGTEITGTVVNEYKYNGQSFLVELRVDAVQAHNAEEALLGAWGVDATVDESGVITSINGNTL